MTQNISRRSFFLSTAATVCAAGMSSGSIMAQETVPQKSIIPVDPDKPFRLLQLTDIHFFGTLEKTPVEELNKKTYDHIKGIVQRFKPDAIVVTGDFWHENPDGKGLSYCTWAAQHIGELGLPWFYAWGNHDQVSDYSLAHSVLEKAPNSLYHRGDGNGNYRLTLADKNSQKPLWQFYMLNSGRIGLSQRETDWLTNECKSLPKTPGFVFCHIPVLQYKEIWDNGSAIGIKNEDVCNEKENGSALPVIAKTGKVDAMFVGHDHVNDYSAVHSGVKLVYGRATGFGTYGADKVEKGATLIEILPAKKDYSFQSVFPDGRTWKQKRDA